jgi:hypothetical protein
MRKYNVPSGLENVTRLSQSVLFLLALLLIYNPASAQHRFTGGDTHIGGFGGPVLKLSAVGSTTAFFVGGRGGMIVAIGPRQHLSIGGGMYGMMSDVPVPATAAAGTARHLRFRYGGLELEYLLFPNDVLQLSAVTLLGAGQVGFDDEDHSGGFGFGHMWGGGGSTLLVVEPGVNLTLNVAPFVRLGFGTGYRFVDGARSEGLRDVELSGWSGQLVVKLGHY